MPQGRESARSISTVTSKFVFNTSLWGLGVATFAALINQGDDDAWVATWIVELGMVVFAVGSTVLWFQAWTIVRKQKKNRFWLLFSQLMLLNFSGLLLFWVYKPWSSDELSTERNTKR